MGEPTTSRRSVYPTMASLDGQTAAPNGNSSQDYSSMLAGYTPKDIHDVVSNVLAAFLGLQPPEAATPHMQHSQALEADLNMI
jgi:hypothetical protein